jgi:hypothetical protein
MITQPRAVKFFGAEPDPVERIFFMFANLLDKAGEPEKLQGLKTAPIHLIGDGEHRTGLHAERPQAQLAIAQRCINELDVFHGGVKNRSAPRR